MDDRSIVESRLESLRSLRPDLVAEQYAALEYVLRKTLELPLAMTALAEVAGHMLFYSIGNCRDQDGQNLARMYEGIVGHIIERSDWPLEDKRTFHADMYEAGLLLVDQSDGDHSAHFIAMIHQIDRLGQAVGSFRWPLIPVLPFFEGKKGRGSQPIPPSIGG